MPWAERAINELSEYYIIKIVSHGYSPNLKQKEEWIKKRFPDIEFIGVNLKEHSDKSHIDMSDGLFIDDSTKILRLPMQKKIFVLVEHIVGIKTGQVKDCRIGLKLDNIY